MRAWRPAPKRGREWGRRRPRRCRPHAVRLRPSGVGAYKAYGDTCIILSDPDAAVTVWRYPDGDAAENDIRWHVNGRTAPDLEVLLETTVEELFDDAIGSASITFVEVHGARLLCARVRRRPAQRCCRRDRP